MKIEILLKKFFWWKLCLARSETYVGFIVDLANKFLMFAIFLKVYNLTNKYLILSVLLIYIVSKTIIGYVDIKYGFASMEMSVKNKINPEIMSIYNKLK